MTYFGNDNRVIKLILCFMYNNFMLNSDLNLRKMSKTVSLYVQFLYDINLHDYLAIMPLHIFGIYVCMEFSSMFISMLNVNTTGA